MINREVSLYLAQIGRRGGLKSRRVLPSRTAREMVRIREARRAFCRFRIPCFWSFDPDRPIATSDIPWIVEQLRKNGGRQAWEAADRLCR